MVYLLSVSDIARRLGASPRDISDLFYRRELRDDICPIVAGRRLIPESYIPQIEAALRRFKPLHRTRGGIECTGDQADSSFEDRG